MTDQEMSALWKRAHEAGRAAAEASTPRPMIVSQHADSLDDRSPVVQQWFVGDGACGFAWIHFYPATQPFVRWLRRQGREGVGRKGYPGGWDVSIFEHNQSVERKLAHARAAAAVLKEAGVRCYAESRLD